MLRRLAPVCALFALAAAPAASAAPAGSPDPAFGTDGVASSAVTDIRDLVRFGDGWAVVGTVDADPDRDGLRMGVGTLDADGTPGGGAVLAQPAPSHDGASVIGRALLATPAGLVGAGDARLTGDGNLVQIARFGGGLALDPSFSDDGFLLGGGGSSSTGALALAASGGIVAGINEIGQGRSRWSLRRYTASGAADTTLDGDGEVTLPWLGAGQRDFVRGVFPTEGATVLAGGADGQAAIARVADDGTVSGVRFIAFPGATFNALSAARTADGGVIVAGEVGLGDPRWALARFDATGAPDTSFGDDGRVVTDLGPGSVSDVAVDGQGRVVAAGPSGPDAGLTVARYRADGSLDAAFGGGGIARPGRTGAYNTAIAVEHDDDVLVAHDTVVMRLLGAASADAAPDAPQSGDGGVPAEPTATVDEQEVVATSGSRARGAFRVRLLSRKLGRRRIVRVSVRWPGDWRGRAVLRITRAKHPVVLGATVLRGRAGGGRVVGVELNRLGRKLVRRGSVRIRVSLVPMPYS